MAVTKIMARYNNKLHRDEEHIGSNWFWSQWRVGLINNWTAKKVKILKIEARKEASDRIHTTK